jgi:hypothetical protein
MNISAGLSRTDLLLQKLRQRPVTKYISEFVTRST